MSLLLELYCVRHRIAVKIFLMALAGNHLPKTEQQSQAMSIALLNKLLGFQLWKRQIFCIKVALREIQNISAH